MSNISTDTDSMNLGALDTASQQDLIGIGGWFHSTNVASTTILDGTFGPLNLSTDVGVTTFAENKRFIISNANEGVLEYTGFEDKTVTLVAILNISKSGSTSNYNLRYAIDRGSGFVALPTPIERMQSISSTSRDSALIQEVILEQGDKIRIEIEGVGTTDSVDVVFASLDIKG